MGSRKFKRAYRFAATGLARIGHALGRVSAARMEPGPLLAAVDARRISAESLERRLLLTTTWTNPAGGDFDTAANWSNGVPTAGVNAVVNIPISAPVTKSTSTADSFASLTTSQPLVLSGGALDVAGNVVVSNTFTLKGGTLKDAVFSSTGSGSLIPTSSGGTLDAVTLGSNVVVPSGTSLQIQDGLTLNNAYLTLNSGSTSGNTVIEFVNTGMPQTLGGAGTVQFSHASTYNSVAEMNLDGAQTIAPTITIDGGGASIQTHSVLTNQGSVSANLSGQTIKISGTGTLQNQGTLSAVNGGTLDAWTMAGNIGSGISVSGAGSTLSLSGQNYVVNAGLSAPLFTTLALGGTWSNAVGSTITASSGTLTLGDTQAWSNAGTILVSNSTVNLGGLFAAAGLGTFNRTNGAVNLTGTEDVQGGALSFTPSTGSWNLAGGTVKNATITFSAGAALVPTRAGGTLDGVSLDNNLTLPPGSKLSILDGLTLNNVVITINPNNASTYTDLTFNDNSVPQTLAGTGTVVFVPNSNAAYPGQILITGNSTATSALTLVPGIEIDGGGGQIVAGNSATNNGLINQGTILADLNGQSIAISGSGIDNQGMLSAINGATLSIAPTNWTNEGTITETGATLDLGGTFTATAGAIVRSGGTVNLTGTDDLQGGTLAFTATTGSWNLAGGTIKNATLTFAAGNSLVPTNLGGILDTVSLASDLSVPAGTVINVPNVLTLDNVTLTLGANGSVNFYGYGFKSIAGTGNVVLAGDPITGKLAGISDSDGNMGISSGIVIHGGVGSIVIYNSGFNNQGTISADVAGQSIVISGAIDNQGTLSATNGATLTVLLSQNYSGGNISATGGSTLTIAGNWGNSGTIAEMNSTLNLGGQFTGAGMGTITSSGGAVNLSGQFTGALTLTPATGSWNLLGGSLWQGGLTCSGGATLVPTSAGGTLNQMILNSDLTVPPGASLTAINGLTLNSANLILDGSSTFTFNANGNFYSLDGYGSGSIVFAGDSASGDVANLNVISGTQPMFNDAIIRGGGGVINLQQGAEALKNYGTISADVSGQSIQIAGGGTLTNVGTLEAAGDTLTYAGDLNLGNGTVEIGIGGTTPGAGYGQFQISGKATLGGTLEATLLDGYVPTPDQSFEIMTYGSSTGSFQSEILDASGSTFIAAVNPTNVVLTPAAAPAIQTNPTDQSVPAGATATFTAAASGNPGPTVQWQVSTDGGKTFTNVPGASNATYSFTAAQAQTGEEFRAVFTNSQGSVTTSAATLTVTEPVSVTLTGTGPNPSNASDALNFTTSVSGGVPDGEIVTLEDAGNSNTMVATGTLSGGSTTLTVPAGVLLAGTHNLIAVYAGDAHFAASQSAPYTQAVQAAVTKVQVNGNVSALVGAQRSMVNSILYTFSEPVNISGDAATIAIHSGQSGTLPTSLIWTAINPNADGSSAQWAVTFSGVGVTGGSIADGVYDITLNPAAVTSDANPAVLAQSRPTDTFYRLFGDAQGTGKVNSADYTAFLSSYGLKSTAPGYLAYFADDGTNKIDSADYNAFLTNYGKKLSGFVATI